jgi:hypothetical protein
VERLGESFDLNSSMSHNVHNFNKYRVYPQE